MSRPRNSVLNLFDPLNSPLTPRRDAGSPDSDKENAVPARNDHLTMSTFFNHTYKPNTEYSPMVLRKRLVDVGDVTVDEFQELGDDFDEEDDAQFHENDAGNASLLNEDSLDEGDIEDITIHGLVLPPLEVALGTPVRQTEKQSITTRPSPGPPRTPLGEISLVDTPVAEKQVFKRDNAVSTSPPPFSSLRHSTRAPSTSPLAAVINAINFPDGTSDSSQPTTLRLAPSVVIIDKKHAEPQGTYRSPVSEQNVLEELSHSPIPPPLSPSPSLPSLPSTPVITNAAFTISPASPPTTLGLPFEISTTHLQPSPRSFARPRAHTTTSSFDPRRTSVDLHSSFNLQLQCPESSFDLLNDKISFLGHESSFLSGMDDDFDLQAEEEMMELLAQKAVAESNSRRDRKEGCQSAASPKVLPTAISEPIFKTSHKQESPVVAPSSSGSSTPHSPTSVFKKRLSLPTGSPSSIPKMPSLLNLSPKTPPKSTDTVYDEVPDLGDETHAKPELSRPIQTPPPTNNFIVPPALAPVPALRIVKRTAAGHERTASMTSTASSSATAPDVPATKTFLRRRLSIAPSVIAAKHRPIITGIQRPPQGTLPPPVLTRTASSALATKAAPGTSLTTGRVRGAAIQRAVRPEGEKASEVSAARSKLQRPGSALGGPHTLASKASTTGSGTSRIGSVSGLRQPSRFGASGVSTDAAAKPAASRLPAPGTRLKIGTGSVGTGSGKGFLARRA